MAITNYAELQAAAAGWLVRADLTARIPDFITLAEARLNRALRARLAVKEEVLTASVGARTIALPLAFAEPLGLWRVVEAGREPLRALEPALQEVSSQPGPPRAWGIDGATIVFDRPCDQPHAFVLRFLARFALSEAQPANGLLADYPDAYLFATLCEAAPFLRDVELAGVYEARLDRALAEINAKDARSRAPGPLGTEVAALLAAEGTGRC